MDLDARWELNSRVLRRFDPKFATITAAASFAVLYSYDKEWTKTGTEGPLFLYQRSEAPYYGLKILNRNDPENFSIGITPDDDIELSDEFIIYRPQHADDADSDESDIYGIWVFEPSQLKQLGETIQKCQHSPYPPPPVPESESKLQSVDMDTLFGSNKTPEETVIKEAQPVHAFTESERNGASILNALFRDAAPSEDWMKQASAPKTETSDSGLPAPAPTNLAPASSQTSDEARALSDPEARAPGAESISLDALFGSAPGVPQRPMEESTDKATGVTSDKRTETPGAKVAPVDEPSQEDGHSDVVYDETPSKTGDESAEEKEEFIDATEQGPLESFESKDSADTVVSVKDAGEPKNGEQHAATAERSDTKDVMEASTTSVSRTSRGTSPAPPQPAESTPTAGPESQARAAQTQNLLSLLATGKAPERLAERSKHLSRMEFVQTMVTLLYTDPEYVDQLYATYLSHQD